MALTETTRESAEKNGLDADMSWYAPSCAGGSLCQCWRKWRWLCCIKPSSGASLTDLENELDSPEGPRVVRGFPWPPGSLERA